MITAVALCPPAPYLVPQLADRMAGQAHAVVTACQQVVGTLAGADQVLVLSLSSDSVEHRFGPGDRVTAAGFARSDVEVVPAARLPAGTSSSPAGSATGKESTGRVDTPRDAATTVTSPAQPASVGTIVAAYLLDAAGITTPSSAMELPPATGSQSLLSMHDEIETGPSTAVLVMANGAACHGESAPGGDDPRSVAFDQDLVTAVASGQPQVLAASCARLSSQAVDLRDDTLPALAYLAQLTEPNGQATATIVHYGAPFGVGYLAATWQWNPGHPVNS